MTIESYFNFIIKCLIKKIPFSEKIITTGYNQWKTYEDGKCLENTVLYNEEYVANKTLLFLKKDYLTTNIAYVRIYK